MGHTYHSLNFHVIFSTRGRLPVLRPDIRQRLFPYLIGVARNHEIILKAVGGVDDHIHLLIGLRPTLAPAKAVQQLKALSSKWIHESFPAAKNVWWQVGYGIFTISYSHIPATIEYIRSQEQHHEKRTFAKEFEAILRKHGMSAEEAWVPTDDEG